MIRGYFWYTQGIKPIKARPCEWLQLWTSSLLQKWKGTCFKRLFGRVWNNTWIKEHTISSHLQCCTVCVSVCVSVAEYTICWVELRQAVAAAVAPSVNTVLHSSSPPMRISFADNSQDYSCADEASGHVNEGYSMKVSLKRQDGTWRGRDATHMN